MAATEKFRPPQTRLALRMPFAVAADVRGHRINIQSVRRRKTQNLALIAVASAELQTTIKTLLNTHKLRHVVAF